MKTIYIGILLFIVGFASAQEIKESVAPLSKKAQKGYLDDVSTEDHGAVNVIFQMKIDKKSDAVSFENYSFNNDLKYIGTSDIQNKKATIADYETTSLYAYVGGSNSFDVLSMKLKINKVVAVKTWNYKKQEFKTKKIISDETVKFKNDNGKTYKGYATYDSFKDNKQTVFCLTKIDTKDKNTADQFKILLINEKLEFQEKTLGLNGSYSLVYCEQLKNENIAMIFAPNKGNGDISKYVYFQFDINGNQVNKCEFKSPASAMVITAFYEKDNSVYFFGSSTDGKDAYDKVFNDYAPINNPGAPSSYLAMKWEKSVAEKMDNFHILRFTGNENDFATNTPVSEFKSKFKTAPGDKDASVYKGKKFLIENFLVTNSNEFLVAGQICSTVMMGLENKETSYEDIVCFHFDKSGNLKAQYGIGKLNDDKKSMIFQMYQNFYPSSDGKSIYLELMEVKGMKGYASFIDAYEGTATYSAHYFPRITKIDLENTSLSPIKVLGNGKYFINDIYSSQYDGKENSILYVGMDKDYENLWLGKVVLK
ncbi:hypothetical protein [Flavobacterium luteum]|uniref:Uncharacterized protein n=1 Tax=Flavobacterium luteum TaxID=2026654 RepID=A0A7J5ADE7_9FLAO|nr:hypothetical protein [Flavobacterium luteum]KAB1155550.1 hypothetical protein F6464_10570 [Flavobacterium luteum]